MNATDLLPTPDEVGAAWMRAMLAGDWEAGWRATDRLELPRRAVQRLPGFAREPHHLVWDGTPFDGRIVLVRCLHGLGDTLQFMRFVPQVAARARELHFLVQPHFLHLLQGAPGLGEVSNAWTDTPPAHDVEIEVMELAYALRAEPSTVPRPYAHLRALARVRSHVQVARGDGLLHVGLLWAASDWGPTRSVPFDQLAPLLRVSGVRFHALQQGPASLDPAVDRHGVLPLWQETGEIADAASAMSQLDLVIAVDGMPAHLAATLGVPTWLLLKHDADWRWGRGRNDTPWYPSMHLYRQTVSDDWSSAVNRAAADLRRAAERFRQAMRSTA